MGYRLTKKKKDERSRAITRLSSLDDLTEQLYVKLNQLATCCMRQERPGHAMQASELVHEAYERLAGVEIPWRDRAHFLGVAAQVMRRILIDHARARDAQKRGGEFNRVTLDESLVSVPCNEDLVLGLDRALEKLDSFDALKGRILVLRFYGGLTCEQSAEVLDISKSTLDRELRLATAWLRHELHAS